jgi:hypothetical protein
MKSFIAAIFFTLSFQAFADDFTVAEKQRFFSVMPDMLREYYDDNAIQECISQASRGSDKAFVSLVVIAHAKKAMDNHTDRMAKAVENSSNKDEMYKKSIEVYKSNELRSNMKLLFGMPKAIQYCNSLVEEGAQ